MGTLVFLGAGLLAGCRAQASSPGPAESHQLSLQSAPWHIGATASLTVRATPPLSGQVISLLVLAPGLAQPLVGVPEFYGLSGVQLLWLSPEQRQTEIALAAASGAKYLSLDFDWRAIEKEPGVYAWGEVDAVVALAKRHNVRLAPMLLFTPRWASSAAYAPVDYQRAPPTDYAAYRDFVYAVVNRYKPHGVSPLTADGYGITDWIIWNEPNVHAKGEAPSPREFWTGSLEAYVQLLRAGYEGAHAADPGCNVLNGALADVHWDDSGANLVAALERLYDPNGDGNANDGARPFFDTLNVHTYPPGQPAAAWYQNRLGAIVGLMKRFGDEQKPIWITETGYGTASGVPSASATALPASYVDEQTQADAVRLVYQTCAAYPQVQRVFWWSLRDYYSETSASNPAMEAHYGLVHVDFSPKPAYLAYGQLTGQLGQSLTLTTTTDAAGLAAANVPAAFISRSGIYTVFTSLGPLGLTDVARYKVGGR